ncbi:hypothetical protein RCL1_004591 [Eukaryota sp. TZLM3-RCL]
MSSESQQPQQQLPHQDASPSRPLIAQQWRPSWKKALLAVPIVGLLTGFIMLKTQLYLPQVIRDQFLVVTDRTHADWTPFVFVCAALGASSLCFSIFAMIAPSLFNTLRRPLYSSNYGRTSSFIGSLFSGFGTAMSGHTPLTLMTQLASKCTSYNPVIGMITGSAAGILIRRYTRWLTSFRAEKQRSKPYLDLVLKMNPALFLALQGFAFTAIAVAASQFLLGWNLLSGWYTYTLRSMIHHPLLSGFLYGSLNLALVPAVCSGFSTFTPISTLTRYLLSMIPKIGVNPPAPNVENHWGFLFLLSSFLSSYFARFITPTPQRCELPIARNEFLGTFLSSFGAQVSNVGGPSDMVDSVAKGGNYETLLGFGLGGMACGTVM